MSHRLAGKCAEVRHGQEQAFPSLRSTSQTLHSTFNAAQLALINHDGQIAPSLHGECVHPSVKHIWGIAREHALLLWIACRGDSGEGVVSVKKLHLPHFHDAVQCWHRRLRMHFYYRFIWYEVSVDMTIVCSWNKVFFTVSMKTLQKCSQASIQNTLEEALWTREYFELKVVSHKK